MASRKSTTPHDPFARYRSRLALDREALDDEIIEQPELYFHVATAAVEAKSRMDEVKLELDEAEAEVAREIRRDADVSGEKLTEASLRQQLQLSPRIKKLARELIEARLEMDRWTAMRESFRQRSSLLPELVSIQMSKLTPTSVRVARDMAADSIPRRYPRRPVED